MPAPCSVALITGGSRGIGFGIARSLAAENWNLAINGIRDEADVAEAIASWLASDAAAAYSEETRAALRAEALARWEASGEDRG